MRNAIAFIAPSSGHFHARPSTDTITISPNIEAIDVSRRARRPCAALFLFYAGCLRDASDCAQRRAIYSSTR